MRVNCRCRQAPAPLCPSSLRPSSQGRLSVPRWTPVVRALGAFLLVLLLAACGGANQSLLEQGEPVDTGRRSFDEYFEAVAELRGDVEGLDSELFELREPMIEVLETDVEISLPALLDETRRRAGKFRDFGVTLNLRLTPEPKLVRAHGELEPDEKQLSLLAAVEESAHRGMTTFKKYSELLERAVGLEAKRSELAEQIDRLPASFTKRDLVETEIVAAGRVLKTIEGTLSRDTRTIAHFMLGLAAAVDTGAWDGHEAKCAEAIDAFAEKKAKGKGKGRGKRPPYRRPRPPRPPPTPPAGGDFEM
jgi:uncharacterized coiled-coil DUF342 family protein